MKELKWSYTFSNQLDCYNVEGEHLGYFLREECWLWHQIEDIGMSPNQLEEVLIKQKGLSIKSRVYTEDGENVSKGADGTF